jgi:hypothetical protein
VTSAQAAHATSAAASSAEAARRRLLSTGALNAAGSGGRLSAILDCPFNFAASQLCRLSNFQHDGAATPNSNTEHVLIKDVNFFGFVYLRETRRDSDGS